jgi:GcrA cell cycle regulator
MSWAAEDLLLLKTLWALGQSAAQIAGRLGYSRNAVCAKLTRLGLKRGRKPATAKPRIMPAPKRRTTLAGLRPSRGKGWRLRGSRTSRQRRNSASGNVTPCWLRRSGIRANWIRPANTARKKLGYRIPFRGQTRKCVRVPDLVIWSGLRPTADLTRSCKRCRTRGTYLSSTRAGLASIFSFRRLTAALIS